MKLMIDGDKEEKIVHAKSGEQVTVPAGYKVVVHHNTNEEFEAATFQGVNRLMEPRTYSILDGIDEVQKQAILQTHQAALEFAVREAQLDERRRIYRAFKKLVNGISAILPKINQPYPDDPRWTPHSRFVNPAERVLLAYFEGRDPDPHDLLLSRVDWSELHGDIADKS
jgi:hypothetical protein